MTITDAARAEAMADLIVHRSKLADLVRAMGEPDACSVPDRMDALVEQAVQQLDILGACAAILVDREKKS